MSINKFNSEGYYDPTAFEAMSAVEKEEKALRAFRPIVYICSPYAGDIETNVEAARRYSRFAVDTGYLPIAPHLLFPQFMDDDNPEERELALFMDIILPRHTANPETQKKFRKVSDAHWRKDIRKAVLAKDDDNSE